LISHVYFKLRRRDQDTWNRRLWCSYWYSFDKVKQVKMKMKFIFFIRYFFRW